MAEVDRAITCLQLYYWCATKFSAGTATLELIINKREKQFLQIISAACTVEKERTIKNGQMLLQSYSEWFKTNNLVLNVNNSALLPLIPRSNLMC